MHIGKSNRREGKDKKILNLGLFVNPTTQEIANPWL
jgi:hypothetical protein